MTAIGIDLGTTNSLVAHCVGGGPEIIPNREGRRKTPSVVTRTADGFIVGGQAQNQLVSNPERTISSIKRYMGDEEPLYLGGDSFTATELSSAILSYLKESAEHHLQTEVSDAVITVPAYFDHRQRVATQEAAELADLNVLRILNEPTAACLSYGLTERGKDTTVLVYDLGGGTFDVSIVEIGDGVFDVLGTDGNDGLGGDDWDGAIVDWLLERLDTEYGTTPPNPLPLTVEERLFAAANGAKHELSSRRKTTVRVPFLEVGDERITVEETLTREQFEAMNSGRVEETIETTRTLLDDVSVGAIDDIVLVGGSTRMPMIRDALTQEFQMEPLAGVRADEAVARGAGIKASVLARQVLPETITEEDVPSLPGTDETDIVLVDSTPKHLGTSVYDSKAETDLFSNIIPKYSPIPARNTRQYHTLKDFQRYIRVDILQSETATLEDAEQLDEFEFGPVPERPAGEVSVEIQFFLTEDGTIQVQVGDTEGFAEEEHQVEITSSLRSSQAELDDQRRQLPDVTNT